MEDVQIVALYWQREEAAIRETQKKYGRYLLRLARGILADARDSEESVNDTYLKAWNSMPPHRPDVLSAYLGRITRQRAIDRFRGGAREKRRATQYAQSLDELADCVSGAETAEGALDAKLLAASIGACLRGLAPRDRTLFVGRYFYMEPIRTLELCHGMSESAVKSSLYRVRQGLRQYLEQEGFSV